MSPIIIPGYTGWVTGGRWLDGTDGEISVFSIHSPTSAAKQARGSYVEESRAIVTAICAGVPASDRLIIGGDFNFKSFGERLDFESIRTTKSEGHAIEEFRAAGFTLAWRDSHPGEQLPQTLRWKRQPAIPYHCDGFLTRGFPPVAVSCEVISGASATQHSDHHPVLLTIA
jgi:endonuclease/exonuclease/phosphatase family metal-dependent hydrolase